MSDNHKGCVIYNPARRTYKVERTTKFHDFIMHSPFPPSTLVDAMDNHTFDVVETLPLEPCDDVFPSVTSDTTSHPYPSPHDDGHTPLHEDVDNDDPRDLTNGLETMAKEEEEPPPRCSARLNKPLTSPSTSKGEEWIPNLPPSEEDASPTYFCDLHKNTKFIVKLRDGE